MRAIVVECKVSSLSSKAEVRIMATLIGYDIVKTVIQRRNSVHHSTCIGPGKLDELKKIISERNVEHIIFSNTLPSSQVFKVQKYLGGDIRVIDRNLLVLEVFEKRAMTKEAKAANSTDQVALYFLLG